MMLNLEITSKFKKDLKKIKKRGYDFNEFEKVINQLRNLEKLDENYKDHALIGDYIGFRECHIQPDWLLIYAISKEKLILVLSRTGTHSDLF